MSTPVNLRVYGLVPRKGFEPPIPFGKRILSPPRLPFRHLGLLQLRFATAAERGRLEPLVSRHRPNHYKR